MTGQQLREALHQGRRVYGSCITNPSVWAIGKYTELDFAFIDNEHVPLGRESTMVLCQAFKARGTAPVVRISTADPSLAGMTLDGGAEGIVCPYMEDPAQVREMVAAVKYRPLKGRQLADVIQGKARIEPQTARYLDDWNHNVVLIINVESAPALERLDELLAVDGLDGVLIGPHDLSVSLDIPEQYENPRFVAAAETIVRKARLAGLGVGLHYWENLGRELHYIRCGANLIIHSTDVIESSNAINSALQDLRAACGDVAAGRSNESGAI